ncbi:MAG: hypothetical protein ACLVL7_10435 [Anaerotruncus massiliensis (ex Togo et al. 2019)]
MAAAGLLHQRPGDAARSALQGGGKDRLPQARGERRGAKETLTVHNLRLVVYIAKN